MNNDLISREALKKAIKIEELYWGKRIIDIIDKAPTVEERYKEKYDQLKEAYSLLAEAYEHEVTKEERPQGEWLWLCDSPNPKYKWSCNKCGRGVKEQENFCPNCGMRMRKGDENCMDEDAKQASIPYTYNAPQHDWKCGYPDITRGEYVDISKLRLMTVEECAGHTIDYAMGWKACVEWIKKGGAE